MGADTLIPPPPTGFKIEQGENPVFSVPPVPMGFKLEGGGSMSPTFDTSERMGLPQRPPSISSTGFQPLVAGPPPQTLEGFQIGNLQKETLQSVPSYTGLPVERQITAGGLNALHNLLQAITDPWNLAAVGMGRVVPAVGRAVSAPFIYGMAKEIPGQVSRGVSQIKQGDVVGGVEELGNAATGTVFTGALTKHMLSVPEGYTLEKQPTQGQPNAETIRSDKGQTVEQGSDRIIRQETSGNDLQQQAQEGSATGDTQSGQGRGSGLRVAEALDKAQEQRGEAGAIMPQGDEKRPLFANVGPSVVLEKSGFGKTTAPSGQQMMGRLRNMAQKGELPPDELAHYESEGLSEFLKQPRTSEEVSKWMSEREPMVEVRKFREGSKTPNQRAFLQFQHEWFDSQPTEIKDHVLDVVEGKVTLPELASKLGIVEGVDSSKFLGAVQKYKELYDKSKQEPFQTQGARWSSIAPKDASEMKGYTEIAVMKPLKHPSENYDLSMIEEKQRTQFGSSHNYPPNTVSTVRLYNETIKGWKNEKTGEVSSVKPVNNLGNWKEKELKVVHAIEVQSDWAQRNREHQGEVSNLIKQEEQEKGRKLTQQEREFIEKGNGSIDDPLLRHYERLALKAAIDHARKEGADAVAVSDGPTAIMTEGQDRGLDGPFEIRDTPIVRAWLKNIEQDSGITKLSNGNLWIEGSVPLYDIQGKTDLLAEVVNRQNPPQEKGMRLHYDQTLPKIAKELTGNEGERVSFGEHKMAMERSGEGHPQGLDLGRVRKDLIFKNSDGTPKTDVTARMYSLERVKDKQFSVYGKDAYKKPTVKERIVAAVIKMPDGSILTGPTHAQAFAKSGLSLDKYGTIPINANTRLFQTSTGRIVSADEAAVIGKESGQVQPTFKFRGVTAEDIKGLDRPTTSPSPTNPSNLSSTSSSVGGSGVGGGLRVAEALEKAHEKNKETGAITLPTLSPEAKTDIQTKYNEFARRSAPRTTAVDEDVGTKLIEFANARHAAESVARLMATDVLGKEYKNPEFDRKLGAVMVEDRQRAKVDAFNKAGKSTEAGNVGTLVGAKDSPFATEADYQTALRDPEIVAAIKRHKDTIQKLAEEQHTKIGGVLDVVGKDTGAFVNLIANKNPATIGGGGKGDLTAPLKRRSIFSREYKGNADAYELSYRKMAERMIQGNYVENAKRDMYQSYIDKGLAKELDPGQPAPMFGKQEAVKINIERKGGGPGQTIVKNLWVRADLAPELRQALQTDSKLVKGAFGALMDLNTSLQTSLGVDALYHTANVFSGLNGIVRPTLGKNLLGVREFDTVSRIAKNMYRAWMDTPDVQRELADVSKMAGSRNAEHKGLLGLPSLGSKWIKSVDTAGRLSVNQLFDELKRAGLEPKDTALSRARMIEQLGQYNERLMSRTQQFMKESGLSPFVVAGKAFNSLAIRRMMLDPGVEAANPQAAAKMRMLNAFGLMTAASVVPIALNLLFTKTITGRSGTPIGAIDTGKDDKDGRPIIVDPLKLLLLRRGARITGISAVLKGLSKGQGAREIASHAAEDIFQGAVHPYVGPSVDSIALLGMGRDVSGFTKAPGDFFDRAKVAAKHINPTIATALDSGSDLILTERAQKVVGSAAGVGRGSKLSVGERVEEVTKKPLESTSVRDRQKAVETLRSGRKLLTPEVQMEIEKVAAEHGFERQKALEKSLPENVMTWLDKNKLKLPRYDEVQEHRVTIPLTDTEEKMYRDKVAQHYKEQLEVAMQVPGFEQLNPKLQQSIVNKRTVLAKRLAKHEVEAYINQHAK